MSTTSIVILNYNGQKFLEQFLPSVVKYSGAYKIIIADNCSTDNSIDYLKTHYPSIQLIYIPENKGYSAGYNYALSKIDSDYYVLLNSDVEVTENWIDPIINSMEKDENIAAVQPKILSYNNKNEFEYAGAAGGYIDKLGYPFCRGRLFNELETDQGQYDDERQVFWATGACLFIRASVFHQLEGFDDDFFAHMEEIDLCWRIINQGYKVMYSPESTVYHVGGGTLQKSNPKKTYLNFRNGLSLLYINYSIIDLVTKLPFRIILDWIAALQFLKTSTQDFKAVINAHIDFIKLFPKNRHKRRKQKSKKSIKELATLMYSNSIVWQFYVRKRKKFSELEF